MYTNKRFFKDKSIIALSVVSVMALSGLAERNNHFFCQCSRKHGKQH